MITTHAPEHVKALPGDLVVTRLTSTHLKSLVACIQCSFPAPDGEVMAKHLGIYPTDYLSYTEMVCAKAVEDGLTYLVCHKQSLEVVSFLICETMISAPKYSTMDISPKFKPLIAILEVLDKKYHAYRQGAIEDTLHLYMLGTAPNYRRFGLGKILLSRVLEDASRNGFKRLIAEATGRGSQSLFESMGFTSLFEESYRDFQLDGSLPFKELTGATHCKLVEYCLFNA